MIDNFYGFAYYEMNYTYLDDKYSSVNLIDSYEALMYRRDFWGIDYEG